MFSYSILQRKISEGRVQIVVHIFRDGRLVSARVNRVVEEDAAPPLVGLCQRRFAELGVSPA